MSIATEPSAAPVGTLDAIAKPHTMPNGSIAGNAATNATAGTRQHYFVSFQIGMADGGVMAGTLMDVVVSGPVTPPFMAELQSHIRDELRMQGKAVGAGPATITYIVNYRNL